jgi:hypothetical protein
MNAGRNKLDRNQRASVCRTKARYELRFGRKDWRTHWPAINHPYGVGLPRQPSNVMTVGAYTLLGVIRATGYVNWRSVGDDGIRFRDVTPAAETVDHSGRSTC